MSDTQGLHSPERPSLSRFPQEDRLRDALDAPISPDRGTPPTADRYRQPGSGAISSARKTIDTESPSEPVGLSPSCSWCLADPMSKPEAGLVEQFVYDAGVVPRGEPVPAEFIERFSQVVAFAKYRRSLRWRTAVTLTSHATGRQPPAVGELRRAVDVRLAQNKKIAAEVRAEIDARAEEVVAFVDGVWRENGRGPTWRFVGNHFGWSTVFTDRVLRAMDRAGMLTSTSDPGSLRRASSNPHAATPSV